jgi:uncharacterized protein YcfJ
MRPINGLLVSFAALALAGCEGMGTAAQSKTVQGGVLGSALGAGTGAIIGHQTGRAGEGAAIGAGIGAVGGALMGNALQEQERRLTQQPSVATTGTKFCPIGGELYSEDIKYCPIHGSELRVKQ